MEAHAYATLFPMMSESEIKTLAIDIKERGQQNPIWVLDGKILDGRNRFAACRLNRVTPKMEIYTGKDPLGFVISSNLHRRHLTESQRAIIAASLATLNHGQRPHPSIEGTEPVTQERAADLLRVGASSVERARKVLRNGTPGLVDSVKSGEVSAYAASHVSRLPKEEQERLVQEGVRAIKDKASKMESEQKKRKDEPDKKVERLPKYIPSDSREIWQQAKITLERILPNDKHREEVLHEIITYCKARLTNNK